MDNEPSGPGLVRFPIRTTLAGVEATVIPTSIYNQLIRTRTAYNEAREERARIMDAIRRDDRMGVPVWRDDEVMDYLVEHLARFGVHAVFATCLSRFGPDRTPSLSAMVRFRRRVLETGHKRRSIA